MSEIIRKFVRVDNDAKLGERQIRIIASDATLDRVGDVMVPEGCDISDYKANPIILAQHDPNQPIGKSVVEIRNGRVEALIDFAPVGVSVRADEYCGLAKHGIITAASVGFEPITSDPIKGGGLRYTKWKLLEISLVSIPANPSALVVERSATLAPRHKGERRNLGWLKDLPGPVDYPVNGALDAFLKNEFPGLPWGAACAKHFEIVAGLSDADCKKYLTRKREAKCRFDAAKSEAAFKEKVEQYLFDQLTPDEQHAKRLKTVARLAPPVQPFRWDPYASSAQNSQRQKIYDMSRKW
jgi:HK97 family phage prohead protease